MTKETEKALETSALIFDDEPLRNKDGVRSRSHLSEPIEPRVMSKTPPYEGGFWFRVDFETVAAGPSLAQAIQRFEASEEGPAGRDGAAASTQWLREFAIDDRSSVTRVLLDEGEVIAYYTLSSGAAEIRDAHKRDVLKFLGGSEIGSSHIKWMARAARAPDGAAAAAILHAGSIAGDLAIQEGKGLLTLDPYDAATEAMWRAWGFEPTDTPSPTEEGLMRLYMPLP